MFKVLLIDDDVPMLKYLQNLIDWEEHDLHVEKAVSSSHEALKAFKETHFDIIVSDIGLPGMDGLQLAQEFLTIKPEIPIIFLTCHEDFHYAQQAIKLKAVDYLIKDELTSEQLIECLKKPLQNIKRTDALINQLLPFNADTLRSTLFERIVTDKKHDSIQLYAKSIGVNWEKPSFLLSFGFISLNHVLKQYSYQDESLIRYGVYNIANELAQKYTGITPINVDNKGFLSFIYNYHSNIKRNELQILESFLLELQQKSRHFLKVDIRFMVCSQSSTLQTIGEGCEFFINHIYDFYYEDKEYIYFSPEKKAFSFAVQDTKSFWREDTPMIQAFMEKNLEKIKNLLKSMILLAKEQGRSGKELIAYLSQLVRSIELQYPWKEIDEQFYQFLHRSIAAQDSSEIVLWKLHSLVKQTDLLIKKPKKSAKLQEINNFIYENLSKNITSADVAAHLFLNPSYFSRYFKKMTGENFTDYVHRFKINIAADLLNNEEQSTEEIATICGYTDRTHFSKVFKKYAGMTPKEYRSHAN